MNFEDDLIELDNVEQINKLDKSNMYSYLCSIAKDTLNSYKKAKDVFLFAKNPIKNIVGAGMGGSGIPPIVIGSLFKNELKLPYTVSQDYNIPRFLNSQTLFIAISDSGETEEVISQYYYAKSRNATIIIIGQGSRLIDIAKKDNIPYFDYKTSVPSRASFAFMFGSLLACLENIDAIRNNVENSISQSVSVVDKLDKKIGIGINVKKNKAKQVALTLQTRIPILYIEPPFESLGPRFAKMMNENAKKFAFYNNFPEIRHNEMMSWLPPSSKNGKFIPILLRDNIKNSKMNKEIEEIKKYFGPDYFEFRAMTGSTIARFYSLLHLIDMIAYYSAILIHKDPSETHELRELKQKLRHLSIIPYSTDTRIGKNNDTL